MTNADGPNDDRRISQVGFGFAVFVLAGVLTVFILNVYWMAQQEWYFKDVLREHMAAIIELPEAAAVSTAIVVFLRQTDGPIEFDGLDSNSKGLPGKLLCGF